MDIECNTTVALTYERVLRIIKERQCSVTFKEHMRYSIKSCNPYIISMCNETGQWRVYNETLDAACNSFVDPFNFTFKNVFCFLCNTDNREPIDLSNCPNFINFKAEGFVSRNPPPFLSIRNLDDILTEQRSKQMQCKEHLQYRDDKLVRYSLHYVNSYTTIAFKHKVRKRGTLFVVFIVYRQFSIKYILLLSIRIALIHRHNLLFYLDFLKIFIAHKYLP